MNENPTIYYLSVDGEKMGPYTLDDLKKIPLTAKTLVWIEERGVWSEAEELSELSSLLPQSTDAEPHLFTYKAPPKTWFVESILVTIFCCMPFGVVGLVYAIQVRSMIEIGRLDLAEKFSKQAKIWTVISFFIGLCFVFVWVLLVILSFLSGVADRLELFPA